MKGFPSIPHVSDAPDDLLRGGHLWIQEKVDGTPLRFQLLETGVVRFGDRTRVYDPDGVPERYEHAVRHVRQRLDRGALRAALDRPGDVVFFGEAMHRRAIDYDWDRTPPFLGFDVWSGTDGGFLPPDAVERVFDRLGLTAVNTFEKEVRAVDFDPEAYDIPDSDWYDGPPEGVVLRNKTGLRAKLIHPWFEGTAGAAPGQDAVGPEGVDAAELARQYVTETRLRRTADGLEHGGTAVTFEALYGRVLEDVTREHHATLYSESVDARAFRSEVAARVREFLTDRR